MDNYTKRHLFAWVERTYMDEDVQRVAFDALADLFETDPEYFGNVGWPRMRDMILSLNPSLPL